MSFGGAEKLLMGELRVAVVRGALVAFGLEIELMVKNHAPAGAVAEEARRRRRDRDGDHHHITLAPKPEFTSLPAEHALVLTSVAMDFHAGRAVPIGLGVAASGRDGTRCWFVAVEWPEAQAARQAAGLRPTHLHVTVGFDGADVHGVVKGPLQLLPLTGAPWPADRECGPADPDQGPPPNPHPLSPPQTQAQSQSQTQLCTSPVADQAL